MSLSYMGFPSRDDMTDDEQRENETSIKGARAYIERRANGAWIKCPKCGNKHWCEPDDGQYNDYCPVCRKREYRW